MSLIISKPAGVQASKKKIAFEIVLKRPYYISFAYLKNGKIYIEKYKKDDEAKGWSRLEALTKFSAIIFFSAERNKVFEKNIDNLCPVPLSDNSAYVASGPILSLSKPYKKKYSDVFYFKDYLFDTMVTDCKDFFFSFAGKWLFKKIIPSTSAMIFLKSNGEIAIVNEEAGETFDGMWWFDHDFAKRKRSLFCVKI